MAISIHAAEDFADVVLGEEVTLYPRGSSDPAPVPNALRGPTSSALEDPDQSAVVAADTKWSLQVAASHPDPQVGDALVDSNGRASVILRVQYSHLLNKWSLEARSLAIPPLFAESVSLQRPIVEGGVTTGWRLVSMACPALVALESISVDDPNAADPVVSTSYRVSFVEPVEATAGDRFVTASGDAFLLADVELPVRLGASFSVRVVPEST